MVPKSIHTPTPMDGFWFDPPTPCLWQFQFCFVLSPKNFGFWDPTPPPSEFPIMTVNGVGMDIFWDFLFSMDIF